MCAIKSLKGLTLKAGSFWTVIEVVKSDLDSSGRWPLMNTELNRTVGPLPVPSPGAGGGEAGGASPLHRPSLEGRPAQ